MEKMISKILCILISMSIFVPNMSFARNKELNISRVSGNDRYETSIEISKNNFEKSKYAIIASGEDFPDALFGGTLAVQIEAPILLSSKNSISKSSKDEIKRLEAEKVYILGGVNTISNPVEKEIEELGVVVERIYGENRGETAVRIAEKIRTSLKLDENVGKIAIVNGFDFSDALSAAPFIGISGETNIGFTGLYPYATIKSIPDIIFGGKNSVPYELLDGGIRLSGENRYETAVEIAKGYKDYLKKDIDTIVLVVGEDYPDALASATVASMNNGAILLTNSEKLSVETKDYINNNNNIKNIIIVGGEKSVSKNIEKHLKN